MGKKKEKITYIDDGHTIADMSNVSGGWTRSGRSRYTPPAPFKEQWRTYWTGVKMMFKPMLVVVGGMAVIYLILYFLFSAM